MERSNLMGRLAVALILTPAFVIVWFIAAQMLSPDGVEKPGSRTLVFKPDGTPLLRCLLPDRISVRFEDLAGKTDEDGDDRDEFPFVYLAGGQKSGDSNRSLDWRDRIMLFDDRRSPPVLWGLISDGLPDAHAYFVGYDSVTKTRVGFIGIRGFRVDMPPEDDRFPFAGGRGAIHLDAFSRLGGAGPENPFTYLSYSRPLPKEAGLFDFSSVYIRSSDGRLYRADLRKRTISVVSGNLHVLAANFYYPGQSIERLALLTDHEVVLLDNHHRIVSRYELPPEAAGQPLYWSQISPGRSIAYWPAKRVPLGTKATEIVWCDQSGRVTRRATATLYEHKDPPLSRAFVLPSPLILGAYLGVESLRARVTSQADNWSEACSMVWENSWIDVATVLVLAVLLAAACYRRESRYATWRRERIIWSLLVLMGGLPVWIAYRLSRRWPVLENCSTCGVRVPRDRERCAHCGAEFPRPASLGTEVLAA